MTAKEAKLSKFLNQQQTRFVIPIYQRNYDWTDKQVDGLLRDIVAVGGSDDAEATHFVGSIVYLHNGIHHSEAITDFDVIDGQQRLTTVSLIYARLLEIAEEAGEKQDAAQLRQLFLINPFAEGDKEKLTLPNNNAPTYRQILEGTLQKSADGSYSRLRENFEHLRLTVLPVDAEVIRRGLARLTFVEISLERGKDDPQRIFESLNSTGLELSQADLIRNHVLMGFSRAEQERLFSKYWEPIERATRERTTNAVMVDQYVRDFLTMTQRKITRKSAIYLGFKEYLRQESKAGTDIAGALEKLRQYAGHYGTLLNPGTFEDEVVRRELEEIKALEINTATPFLMQVLEDYSTQRIDRQTLIDLLRLIQTYVWRRFMLNLPTNTLNKTFTTLYDAVDYDDYVTAFARELLSRVGTARFPHDKEFRSAARERDLYSIRAKNLMYLFRQIEGFNNRERVDLDPLTIEHIFPQKPAAGWRRDLDPEQYGRFESVYLHRLGNLTLSGNNGALGNKPFVEKRDMNTAGKEQGYRFSRLFINRDLRDLEGWDEQAFKQRTERLVDRMLDIWPLPERALDSGSTEVEYTPIEELQSATGASVTDAKLFGINTGAITFADLFRRVWHELYERDSYRLRDPEFKAAFGASSVADSLRNPYEVAKGYYVETHSANDVKLRTLQRLIEVTESEGEVAVALAFDEAD